MKEILKKIQLILIRKKTNGFVQESDISALVEQLFDQKKNLLEKYSEAIIPLLKDIIAMNKTSGAFDFYRMLEKSNLSFSEELLRYGVETEPYYNNNDLVLVYYLSVLSRDIGTKELFEKFSESVGPAGHYGSYRYIFSGMTTLRAEHGFPRPTEKMRVEVPRIIGNTAFYQTRQKAIAFALLLGIEESIPCIKKTYDKTTAGLVELLTNNSSDYLDLINAGEDFTSLAFALHYLETQP